MLKLLHTADWQIGRVYSRFQPEDAFALQEARFQAVERLAQLATEQQVDAVIVAGDVFDAQSLSERTIRRLFNTLSAFQGNWLFIPGNHDAMLAEGVWQTVKRLGLLSERVQLLDEAKVTLLDSFQLAVLPAPLRQRHTVHDLSLWFDDAMTPPDYYRVGIAHGSVQGILAEEASHNNPIAANRAASAKLDYLALGDWHGLKQIDPRTWYSGTPEPDRFRNNDAGCALIVSIAHPGAVPTVERVETARYCWVQLEHRIEGESDLDALAIALQPMSSDTVLELTVVGQVSLEQQQRLQTLLNEHQARLRSLEADTDQLTLVPDNADIAALKADGYVAQVLEQLRHESEQGQRQSAQALIELASILGRIQQKG